jgi:hypothetical protein
MIFLETSVHVSIYESNKLLHTLFIRHILQNITGNYLHIFYYNVIVLSSLLQTLWHIKLPFVFGSRFKIVIILTVVFLKTEIKTRNIKFYICVTN